MILNRRSLQGFRVRAASVVATVLCLATMASPGHAAQIDIVGPVDSGAFGASVTVLPNGNIVITDPDAGVSKTGAVYLYGPDRHRISRLTGSSPDDRIGSAGIVVLTNGHFVICSPHWSHAGAADAGAATWVDGRIGLSGVVSAHNSLVGTTNDDEVGGSGADGRVVALSNGNYVVASPNWNNGVTRDGGSGIGIYGAGDFGAVTWGSGTAGVTGAVSASNSLVGTTKRDHVGEHVTALSNGNYVVTSSYWGNGVEGGEFGAVTWADGTTGLHGPVSIANSLTGAVARDQVGSGGFNDSGITALSNGNYVVASRYWNSSAGAATWGNGTSGIAGLISAANSLIGTMPGDAIGADGITALSNGNYVVASSGWNDGVLGSHGGAVTWGNGASGTVGPVSSSNSLLGTPCQPWHSAAESASPVTPLSNGNYVVATSCWKDALAQDATPLLGAATWCNGMQATVGRITPGNSLVGAANGGRIAGGGVVALSNGNYVVVSPLGETHAYGEYAAGAATWGNGQTGTTGLVSPANSLMGYIEQVIALAKGNYVAITHPPFGIEGGSVDAAIWGDGASGAVGPVSPVNERPGLNGFQLAYPGKVTALSNGHYVISNPWWSNDLPGSYFGAVTWGNGAATRTETVSVNNSLTGTVPGGMVGSDGVIALSDGRYVVTTYPHDGGPFQPGGVDFAPQPGGVTLVDGRHAVSGTFGSSATVIGGRVHSYDSARQRLAVGRPQDNIVTLLTLPVSESTGHARRPSPPLLLRHRERAG